MILKITKKLFLVFALLISVLSFSQQGSSLRFDGSNDYISVPVFDFSASNKLTIEAWVKPINITSNPYYEISRQQGSPDWIFSFQDYGTILSFGLSTTNGYTELDVAISASSFTDGNWHHVAAVYDGVTKKIYKDGVLLGTENKTGNVTYSSSATNNIGAYGNGAEHFNGSIDEVRFWNRALSITELNNNKDCELSGTQTNLYAYYKFNNGTASGSNSGITNLVDESGNNRNGTLVNFALSGSNSNWVTPGGVTTGVNCTYTTFSATSSFTNPTCQNDTNATATVTAAGGTGTYTYLWAPTGGTDASATNLTAGNYTCTITSGGESIVKNFVIVNPIGITNTTNQNACGSFTWSVNGQTYTTSGTYNGTSTNGSGCPTIEILNLFFEPTTPTGFATQIYTGNTKTLADLTVVGDNLKWYTASTGGTLLSNSTVLTDNTTYYATQTVCDNESINRLAVNVKKISEVEQNLCDPTIVANLVSTPSSNNTVSWFASETGGTALSNSDVLATNTYYVQQATNPSPTNFGSGLYYPRAITANQAGDIIVADYYNSAVKKISNDGSSIVTLGSGFSQPYAIALDNSENIYVADYYGNSIKKMNPDGSNITTIGNNLYYVKSIAVDASGNIFVVDGNSYSTIQKISPSGTTTSFGSSFYYPQGLAIDAAGNIYVADSNNNAVKKMDSNGNNIITLGSGFNYPKSIEIDNQGNIYVIDNNGVKKMDANGNNIQTIYTGSGNLEDVTVDAAGNVYLTSYYNLIKIPVVITTNRVPVAVNVSIPPTGNSNQVYVGTKTIGDLVASGTDLKWYDASNTLLTNATVLIDNATYSVTQTINGEESCKLYITVKKISESSQNLCAGATVANLITTPSANTTTSWFTTQTGGNPLVNTTVLSTGTYYIEQASNTNPNIIGNGFYDPQAITSNAAGEILIADSNNNTIKKMDSNGNNIITLASGFNYPRGIAVDATGNIYVADYNNSVIKKMDASGNNITTVSSVYYPRSIAVDAAGNIYVVDSNSSNSITKISPSGTVSSFGSGFYYPGGVAVDAAGNVYVADSSNYAIKKMDSDGNNIVTLGSGFNYPKNIEIDAQGNIYVADNSGLKKMDANGNNIITINTGSVNLQDVTVDTAGNVYVTNNNTLIKIPALVTSNRIAVTINISIPPTGNANQIYVGTKTIGDLVVSGTDLKWYDASNTLLTNSTVLIDNATYSVSQTINGEESCKLYITVKKISDSPQNLCESNTVANLVSTPSSNNIVSWFASDGGGTALSNSDVLTTTTYYVEQSSNTNPTNIGNGFYYPYSLTSNAAGEILIADSNNGSIKKMDSNGNNIITLGSGFSYPRGIAVDATGTIYVADYYNQAIIKMDANGNNITTVGSVNYPKSVAVDATGNMYVVDNNSSNTITKISPSGTTSSFGSGFYYPEGVAVDAAGNVYVADSNNYAIKKMDSDGNNIVTLGSGFNYLRNIEIDAQGNIYVADNNELKKMDANGNNIVTINTGSQNLQDVTVDTAGNVYVTNYNTLVKIPVAITSNRLPVSVIVSPNVQPIFTQIEPICSGATLVLPTTSNNGITGTWSPSANNTQTTTYTFTPTAGVCAFSATMTIVVNPNVIPLFTQVAAICPSDLLSDLPTTSNNGVTGTWSPALNNSATTTYTFTANSGCFTTATMTIVVSPIYIANSLTASPNEVCVGGTSNISATSTGNTINWFTTPTGGTPIGNSASGANFTVNPTATTTYYAEPVGIATQTNVYNIQASNLINLYNNCSNENYYNCSGDIGFNWTDISSLTPQSIQVEFVQGIECLSAGDNHTTSMNGNSTNGFATPTSYCTCTPSEFPIVTLNLSTAGYVVGGTNTFLITNLQTCYGFAENHGLNNYFARVTVISGGGGQVALCTNGIREAITVNVSTPTFTQVAPICSGEIIASLPTTSNNGVSGTWSPVLDNTTTTTYTFTPSTSCEATTTMTIVVNPATNNTTTITSCDSYTWSINGQTYSQSGTYSNIVNCATEILELTITPSSQNTTTIDTNTVYVWDINGQTYSETGTYTYVDGCITYVLNLTINPATIWYADTDGDGFGNPEVSLLSISLPQGYVADNSDCDDTRANVNPNAIDVCYDGLDNDCNGIIDNACTPINTVLQTSQCGNTLPLINSYIYANVVAGAQGYRFKVTDMSNMTVQSIDRALRVFQLTQLTNYKFNNTYQVEVAVRVNNVWQPFYGTPCIISTPATTTQLQAVQCGGSITSMNDLVYANLVPFATGYRFRVTNLLTSDTQIVDKVLREFRMSQLTNPQYNALYSVEVAVRNTDGTYLPYGTVCNISTTAFPTTSLQNSQCDYTATNSNQVFYADSYTGAAAYRFKFVNTALGYSYTFDKPIRSFVLSSVPGLVTGTSYSVQVAIEIGGVFGPFGKICTLTTPGAQKSKEILEFNAVAFPNPFATNFMLNVGTSSQELVQIRVYDMLGKLIEDRKISTTAIADLQIGDAYPAGVYNVIVSQDENTKTLRVIKR